MTPYGFFRALRMLAFVAFFPLMGIFACAITLMDQLRTEASFRSQFGAAWKVEYEKELGSLSAAHTRVVLCAIGIVTLCALSVWIYKLIRPSHRDHSSRKSRKRQPQPYRSPLERVARWKRNAVLGVYFGAVGILAGVVLVLFRVGLFADHANESALGVCVFFAGDAGVIAGCFWWLKAKQWSEAIVVIGVLPLLIFCIRYVRLVFWVVPALLPLGMVMMPLVLIVVVLALPDRSRQSRRGARGRSSHRAQRPLAVGSTAVPGHPPAPAMESPSLAPKDP